MSTRDVDVLVIGGGPAGLSAARRLAELRAGSVLVVDREASAGGIPRHCFHPGYGIRDLHTVTSGPRYAARLEERAREAGVEIRTGTTVTGWADADEPHVRATSPDGVQEIRARAVLLATGVRERPRSARLVPGDRPGGVWTTGQLQQAVHLHHQPVGRRAVVVGAELVSYSAVLTLRDAGCRVAAMVTEATRPQTYRIAQTFTGAVFRVPLHTRSRVTRIIGRPQVAAVEITDSGGRVERVPCDLVVFSADWIPDNELARAAGIALVPASRAPLVDSALATPRRGVYAAGNLVHPAESADLCSLGGRHAAESLARYLGSEDDPGRCLQTAVDGALAWVSPPLLRPGRPPVRGKVMLTAAAVVPQAVVEVRQDGRLLHRSRIRGGLVPGRPVHVGTGWLRSADLAGGPVTFVAVDVGRR